MANKCIILLLDGTWNDAESGRNDTNIVRMRQIIAKSLDPSPRLAPNEKKMVAGPTYHGGDVEHIVFYERGLGTGMTDRLRGGGFGRGLDTNIRRAYKFLSHYYEPDDQVFVFGFSRGAYTARSLIGLIGAAGLLKRQYCTAEHETLAWAYYRTSPNDRLPGIAAQLGPFVHDRKAFKIDCVGVFDTVGALGVPLKSFWRHNRQRYEFHNVELSSIAKVNLHAIAIDEHRHPFQAAVWRKPRFKAFKTSTEQVWFPGAHADVGGGYVAESLHAKDRIRALDDIALDWMLKRVKHYYGQFPFDPQRTWRLIDDRWAGAPGNEPRGGIYHLWPFAQRMLANHSGHPRPRSRDRIVCYDRHADPIEERVHVSALLRLGQRVVVNGKEQIYRPWNLLCVLDTVEATYGRPAEQAANGVRIPIVDWSGAVWQPDSPGDKSAALQVIGNARARLHNAT